LARIVRDRPAGRSLHTKYSTPHFDRKNVEPLGTGVAIALPVVAGGIAIWKHDRIGVSQLTLEGLLTVGTT
jgi:hypothetical protein